MEWTAMGHQKTAQRQTNIRSKIEKTRGALARQHMDLIISLDELRSEQWSIIVATALEAGLRRETLCRELSCSWSTILRWKAGETSPGPFARGAIKAKLVEMISSQAEKGQLRPNVLVDA